MNAMTVPRPTLSSTATDPLADETAEIASWRWNWGAFLVPGIWLLAHRIRPKIVPLALLGAPMAIIAVTTIVAFFNARTAETAMMLGTAQFLWSASYAWHEVALQTGWLLALYIFACLLSIKAARYASVEAWRNFPSQRLATFRSAQRIWSVVGLLLCGALIGCVVLAWASEERVRQAESGAATGQ